VTGLSENGTFFLADGAGRTAVILGQELTAEDVATLVFVPNQGFGKLVSEESTQRDGAVLELTFTAENGSVQTRDLAVSPGDFDGQSLDLTTPTDTDHPAQSFSLGELALADGVTSAEVASFLQPAWSTSKSVLDRVQALFNAGATSQAQLDTAQANFDALDGPYQAALSDRDAAEASLAAAEATLAARDAALDMGLDAALVDTRFGDAQAYRITEISEGGKLWLTETAPAESATDLDTYGVARELAEGDVITRADFDNLAFGKEFGLIDESCAACRWHAVLSQ